MGPLIPTFLALARLVPAMTPLALRWNALRSAIRPDPAWLERLRESVPTLSKADMQGWLQGLSNRVMQTDTLGGSMGSKLIRMPKTVPLHKEALLNSLGGDVSRLNNPATRQLLEGSQLQQLAPADKYATFQDLMRLYRTPEGPW